MGNGTTLYKGHGRRRERNLTVQEGGARRWPRGAAALRLGSATQQDLAGNGGLKLEAVSCIQKMDNISWILRWNF